MHAQHSFYTIRIMRSRVSKSEIIVGVIVALLFLFMTYITKSYEEALQGLIGIHGVTGMFMYIFITVLVVVFAPVSTLPILPIAVTLWGSFIAALLSIVGWVIGSVIAFVVARKYGHSFIRKFAGLRKIQKYGENISHGHLFWSVVFLRIVMPVDALSYALGLFSKMPFRLYLLATIIGITPFAFVFSYAASLPILYQIGALTLSGLFIALGYKKVRNKINEEN